MDDKTKIFKGKREKEKNRLITAMVFISEESNGLVIHFNGFENEKHALGFADKMMKSSGINYRSVKELMDLPTVH